MVTTNTTFHDFFQNTTFVFMDHPPRSGYSYDACMNPIVEKEKERKERNGEEA